MLTPQESRVLEQIRLGKTNSEIAHELAISVAGVKYHVGNMLSKLGVADRAGLAAWQGKTDAGPAERNHRGLSLSVLGWWKAAAAAAGLVAAGTVAAVWSSWNDSAPSPAGPEPVAFETPAGYERMTAADLEALGMVDAGLILRADNGRDPVVAVQVREALSPMYLGEQAEVVEGPGAEFALNFVAVAPNAVYLTGKVETEPIRVTLWSQLRGLGGDTNIVIDDDRTRRILFTAAPTGQLVLSVTSAINQRPLTAGIATNGHLFVHPAPLSDEMVLDNWTGTELDLSDADEGLPLGPIGQGLFRFTGCDSNTGVCSVSFRAFEPLTAPFAGTLRCLDRETVEIENSRLKVRIERVNTGYGGSADFACEPHPVAAGDVIGDRGKHWSYTAFAPSGEQLSTGVSYDGRFFVGEFGPTVGCPCLTGR